VVSAPPEPSLLNITTGWARASSLGPLPELRVPSDYLELRVWHGYGPAETQSIVIRRSGGRWSAFLGRVIRCEIEIPSSVGDTASPVTMRQYVARARRNCGASVTNVSPGARLLATDTLVVQELDVPESDVETAWKDALDAGLLRLPPRVDRKMTGDGTMYVIEVRRGDEYRATELEDLERPEVEADSAVKRIYSAVHRLVRP